jgi:hypothetical protein
MDPDIRHVPNSYFILSPQEEAALHFPAPSETAFLSDADTFIEPDFHSSRRLSYGVPSQGTQSLAVSTHRPPLLSWDSEEDYRDCLELCRKTSVVTEVSIHLPCIPPCELGTSPSNIPMVSSPSATCAELISKAVCNRRIRVARREDFPRSRREVMSTTRRRPISTSA